MLGVERVALVIVQSEAVRYRPRSPTLQRGERVPIVGPTPASTAGAPGARSSTCHARGSKFLDRQGRSVDGSGRGAAASPTAVGPWTPRSGRERLSGRRLLESARQGRQRLWVGLVDDRHQQMVGPQRIIASPPPGGLLGLREKVAAAPPLTAAGRLPVRRAAHRRRRAGAQPGCVQLGDRGQQMDGSGPLAVSAAMRNDRWTTFQAGPRQRCIAPGTSIATVSGAPGPERPECSISLSSSTDRGLGPRLLDSAHSRRSEAVSQCVNSGPIIQIPFPSRWIGPRRTDTAKAPILQGAPPSPGDRRIRAMSSGSETRLSRSSTSTTSLGMSIRLAVVPKPQVRIGWNTRKPNDQVPDGAHRTAQNCPGRGNRQWRQALHSPTKRPNETDRCPRQGPDLNRKVADTTCGSGQGR